MNTKEKSIALELSHKLIQFFDVGIWYFSESPSPLTEAQINFIFEQLHDADCERTAKWLESKKQPESALIQASYRGSTIRPHSPVDEKFKKEFMDVLKAINDPSVPKVLVREPVKSPPTSAVVNEVLDEFKESGITQRQVADKMGLGESAISNWKHDHSPIPTDRLHQLLNLRDKLCR